MKNPHLAVLRHGLTRANTEGFYIGAGSDWPLCEQGVRQLQRLAAAHRYPAAQVVFTGPLLRCRQTADILYPGVRQIVLQDLRERHLGAFEGKSASELADDPLFRRWLNPQDGLAPAGGEDGASFARRTGGLLMKMFEFMLKSGLQEAACITHNGVAMGMLAAQALPQRPAAQWTCDPGCGFWLQCSPQAFMRDGLAEALCILPQGYGEAPPDDEP